MEPGFLHIQTSRSHPGLLRLLATSGEAPSPAADENADPAVVYVARFEDVDAARLHVIAALRHQLLDIDAGLFRVGLEEAVAAVESVGLAHRRLYLDPALDGTARRIIAGRTTERVLHRERIDRLWQAVGWVAAAWLLFLGIFSF